ncbi:MAG: hypothetical protein Q8O67_03975 [Deltaproteobacteria bacterium]|nr:hypothetical protein [Deltaproteobacteria bacterium]
MLRPRIVLLSAVLLSTSALPSYAQRSVAGDDDDEDDDEKKPEEKKPEEKKPEEKKDDKKKKKLTAEEQKAEDKRLADEKAAADKKAAEEKTDPKKDPKKVDEHKPDPKKPVGDVLDDTAEDRKKRKAEDDAKKKADDAAASADKKKADDKARLAEEKKSADDKRKVDTREQRLASAKRVRPLLREEGDIKVQVAIEPGAVVKEKLVEVRLDLGKLLTVADPKFGNREPLKNLNLTATVTEATGKKDSSRSYAVHSLGAPGKYGFHLTPPKDGLLQVQITGDVDGRSLDLGFPLHVGVWPPPDFDDEDLKLVDRKGS